MLLEQTGPNGLVRNLGPPIPASLLKNIGLGHVYLIQNKVLDPAVPIKFSFDFFMSAKQMGWPGSGKSSSDWRLWAAERFAEYWGAFVRHPDGVKDPQYETVRDTWRKATTKPHENTAKPKAEESD